MPRTTFLIAVTAAALAVAVPTAAAEGQPTGAYRAGTVVEPQRLRPEPVRDDRFRVGPSNDPVLVAPAPSAGPDLGWAQIGTGIAFLIAFVTGTHLAVRSRERPLAH